MKLWAIIVGVWLALVAPAVAQDHPLKGVALVIGESKYDGLLPALSNPRNDARAMDDLLSDLGFDVTRVLDGDKHKLDSEIADFEAAAQDADVALVYYSGHGIEAGGADYLVPVDADLSSPQQAGAGLIPVDALLQQLGRTVPVTIMLLDACRTNGLPAGTLIQPPGAGAPLVATDAGLAVVRGPTPLFANVSPDQLGTVIGFAASPGQSALDGAPGDANSPYAAALLKHLGAGGYSFGDLMTMVSEEVYLKTGARQLPWVNSSLRRVLTFGTPLPAGDADDAAIADGRRQLLLSIAKTPEATRGTVESIAAADGVPLDALYGMLKVLGVDTSDPTQLQDQLQQGATQLKAFMAQRPGAAKSDPELARLSALADKAQNEGAIDLALKYRAAASTRADALDKQVDQNEANLKADRLQLAATYAEHAETAVLNFDYATAATRFGDAFTQAEKWDLTKAIFYRSNQAASLADLGGAQGSLDLLKQAVALYQETLKLAPRDTAAADYSALQNDMATVYVKLAEFTGDLDYLRSAKAALDESEQITASTDDPDRVLTLANLGSVQISMGERTSDAKAIADGIAQLKAVQPLLTKDYPFQAMQIVYDIGATEMYLGTLTSDAALVAQGNASLAEAADDFGKAGIPLERASALYGLGEGLLQQAKGEKDTHRIDQAIAVLKEALALRDRQAVPVPWAETQILLGQAQQQLGTRTNSSAPVRDAIASFDLALGILTLESTPRQWATAQRNLGFAWLQISKDTLAPADAQHAIDAYESALKADSKELDGIDRASSKLNLGSAQLLLGGVTKAPDLVQAAKANLLAGIAEEETLKHAVSPEYRKQVQLADQMASVLGAAK